MPTPSRPCVALVFLAFTSAFAADDDASCAATTVANMPNRSLADGTTIPAIGLGLYYTPPGSATYDIVSHALQRGYRHLDTAGFYENEADVGRAVRDSGIARDEIHITSKVWPLEEGLWLEDGFQAALDAVRRSVDLLGTYADLYLIHWPCNPSQRVNYWRALEQAQREGLVGHRRLKLRRAPPTRDSRLSADDGRPCGQRGGAAPVPAQGRHRGLCRERGIRVIAYSPLVRASVWSTL